MPDYRENVLDVLGNWDFDALTPCDQPAINSGHVQVKCFINNVCPFHKTPHKEDSIVFNFDTMKEILGSMPQSVVTNLSLSEDLEGIFFKPRKVYRHNYISKSIKTKDLASPVDPLADVKVRTENYDNYYKDIGNLTGVGADQTRYKKEHDWIIVDSVFESTACPGLFEGVVIDECTDVAQWEYTNQAVSESGVTDQDLSYDYYTDWYTKYTASLTVEDGKPILKNGEVLRISKYEAQMPILARTFDSSGHGIHWKLMKRTPVFQGTDFFIRFYKRARNPVRNKVSDSKGAGVEFRDKFYSPLDYTSDNEVAFAAQLNDDVPKKLRKWDNEAVRPVEESKDSSKYDFFTQAYYIIELAREYFIVIHERGYPILVHFFSDGDISGAVSKKMGPEFEGIHGSDLINADFFEVTVRNHLGRLEIRFSGQDLGKIEPWIVERLDWVIDTDGANPFSGEKFVKLSVPKGRISIWGGNLKCGFIFGYLQYSSGHLSFLYPPRPEGTGDPRTNEDLYPHDLAFVNRRPKSVSLSSGFEKNRPLWMPLNGTEADGTPASHKLVFESYSGPPLEKGAIGDDFPPFPKAPLFTQDAQFYRNWDDSANSPYRLGYFYNNFPVKEFSPGKRGVVKTSLITIKKYTYLNKPETKHQGFDTQIGMMCGDHLFKSEIKDNDGRLIGSFFPLARRPSLSLTPAPASSGEFEQDDWYLPNCKTPILASLRIISDHGPLPRWQDGTTVAGGSNRDPGQGKSSYFIDASDHVTNFSHSWTSSGMTNLEHSGTIQFYLNPNMTIENQTSLSRAESFNQKSLTGVEEEVSEDDDSAINNVTNSLLALQDKTFYIEVWGGYKQNINPGNRTSTVYKDGKFIEPDPACEHSNYTRVPGVFKMFTGLCQGGSISYEYGKTMMTCKLEDYNVVLKNMLFFNSPWFDAMKDSVAIGEILKMAGFRDQGKYDPGSLLRGLSYSAISGSDQLFFSHFDGRVFKNKNFGLPSGYNRMQQPAYKFNDGDPFIDAISKISKVAGKLFYFDEYGIAHYEDYQDIVEKDFEGKVDMVPLYSFTINPEITPGILVFNKVERAFEVEGVYNHLKMLTNTPDMHLLIRDNIKWESLENPEIAGFLGFKKTFYQVESMFGSEEAQRNAINKYAVAFKPLVTVRFETYGIPLRATDIVSLGGEVIRVTSVDHQFDASKNLWWMTVACQRYQAVDPADLVKPPPATATTPEPEPEPTEEN